MTTRPPFQPIAARNARRRWERRARNRWIGAFSLLAVTSVALSSAADAGDYGATQADEPTTEEIRRQLLAQPGMMKIMRDLFAGTAMQVVRLERLVGVGQLCRVLDQEDADEILRNGHAMLADSRRMIADEDAEWATTYLEGLRVGATQSADLLDVVDEDQCRKFAESGGALTRILTWTDKPQESSPGVRASPRTFP